MLSQTKGIPHWIITISCSLVFALLLAACGGATASAPTPTPAPTSPPTPPSTPTSPPSPGLTTYTGAGYTIGYPQGWKVSKAGNGIVTFVDPQGVAYLTITAVPDPNGVVSAITQVSAGLQLFKSLSKNYQRVNIAATTMVGGDTWSRGAATGTITPQGGTTPVAARVVVIANNHPAASPATVAFTIAYVASQSGFDAASSRFFQPMLQSFKFS